MGSRGSATLAVCCACAALVAAQDSARTTWGGVYTEAQAKRGETVYGQSCASCHAPDLSGMDAAPALTGPEFAVGWDTMTLDDLVERVRTSMPADAPGSLKREDYVDVVAFMLSKNGFPTGERELPADSAALKQVRFTAKKP